MSFLQDIFAQLRSSTETPVLQESGGRQITAGELLELVCTARMFLSDKGLKKGDRCALLAHNSIRWVAMNLAVMAEGLIAVPLYARQSAAELVGMMKDCSPSLICCGDAVMRDAIPQHWPQAPQQFLFDEIFSGTNKADLDRLQVADTDPVTIIYTSGTSGEPKGVVLTASNIGYMLGCTSSRLDSLLQVQKVKGNDRVFHDVPYCFAGS